MGVMRSEAHGDLHRPNAGCISTLHCSCNCSCTLESKLKMKTSIVLFWVRMTVPMWVKPKTTAKRFNV